MEIQDLTNYREVPIRYFTINYDKINIELTDYNYISRLINTYEFPIYKFTECYRTL